MSQVKWFSSTDTGAPSLNNAASSLLSVLRGCLVTGYNTKSVTSIAVASGVATATCAAHGFQGLYGKLILISGSSETLLNGVKQPTVTGTNTFTYPAPGVADGTYTGTISAKRAPAGYEEAFTGTNTAAFRSLDVAATGAYLRVDDAAGVTARVVSYESMSSVDVGTGPTPTPVQFSGGLHWHKAEGATIRQWTLVSDGRAVFFASAPFSTNRWSMVFAGDINRLSSSHVFSHLLVGKISSTQNTSVFLANDVGGCARQGLGGAFLMRQYTDIGGAVAVALTGSGFNGHQAFAANFVYAGNAGYSFGAYPNGPNNGLLVGELNIYAPDLIGSLPGLYHPVQDLAGALVHEAIVDALQDLNGRKLLAHSISTTGASGPGGILLLDLTGPWSYQS